MSISAGCINERVSSPASVSNRSNASRHNMAVSRAIFVAIAALFCFTQVSKNNFIISRGIFKKTNVTIIFSSLLLSISQTMVSDINISFSVIYNVKIWHPFKKMVYKLFWGSHFQRVLTMLYCTCNYQVFGLCPSYYV